MREVSVVPPSRLMGLLEQVSVSLQTNTKLSKQRPFSFAPWCGYILMLMDQQYRHPCSKQSLKIQQNSDQLSPEMTIDTPANKNRLMEKETFPTQLYRHIKVDMTVSLMQALPAS